MHVHLLQCAFSKNDTRAGALFNNKTKNIFDIFSDVIKFYHERFLFGEINNEFKFNSSESCNSTQPRIYSRHNLVSETLNCSRMHVKMWVLSSEILTKSVTDSSIFFNNRGFCKNVTLFLGNRSHCK